MTNDEFLFRVGVMLVVMPVFVYFCLKFGTLGFLVGKHRFQQFLENLKDADQT